MTHATRGEFGPTEMLIGIVFTLIVALVIFFFIGVPLLTGRTAVASSLCEMSITTASDNHAPDFNCAADSIEIKRSDFASLANIDEGVKRTIADKMYECWRMTGAGKWNPYTGKNTRYCLICSTLRFDDKLQEQLPRFQDFYLWMSINKPRSKEGAYFDLIYNHVPSEKDMKELKEANDAYDTSKQYAVVWVYRADTRSVPPTNLDSIPPMKQESIYDAWVEQDVRLYPYADMLWNKDNGCDTVMN